LSSLPIKPIARLLAAAMVLAGGAIHLNLWLGGYRGVPYIGPMFLVNVALSVFAAGALLISVARPVALASAALSAGSLVALVVSRTVGLLGFREPWTPRSIQIIAAEVGAVVAIAAAGAATGRWNPQPRPATVRSSQSARLSR